MADHNHTPEEEECTPDCPAYVAPPGEQVPPWPQCGICGKRHNPAICEG